MAEVMEKITTKHSTWAAVVAYVDEWTLMPTPYPMLIILVTYLLFVLKLGPQLMKDRAPFKLNNVLLVYNAFQVAVSLYIFSIGALALTDSGLIENGTCYMNSDVLKRRILEGHYIYFLAKLSELLDTIFFVLRKKWNQLTFLHIYHHSIMFSAAWMALKFEPSFSLVFLGTINSFVHIIMYAYYGLSAFPGLEKYLWWKKYITKMQLFQFILVIIQITWNSLVTACRLSYFLLTMCWMHFFLFVYLFTDFYIKSYLQKRRVSRDAKISAHIQNGLKSDDVNKKAANKSR